MKTTRTLLLTILWGALALAIAVIVICETGLLQPGWLTGNVVVEYVTAVVLELTTLVVIPLSLWLFKWRKVAADLKERKAKALATWGVARLLLLCVPMLAAIIAYYLFLTPTFYYLSLILAICLFFIYPSEARCAREVQQ